MFPGAPGILHGAASHAPQPLAGGPQQGPIHLCLPHCCGDLNLCTLHLHLCKAVSDIPYGQSGLCAVHDGHAHAQSCHLYSEKQGSGQGREEAVQDAKGPTGTPGPLTLRLGEAGT